VHRMGPVAMWSLCGGVRAKQVRQAAGEMIPVGDDAAACARPAPKVDTTVSHSARIWNYWLGGTDNYPADREAGDKVAAMLPSIVAQARADRAFLGRAVRYLAGEAGIGQFLDIASACRAASPPR